MSMDETELKAQTLLDKAATEQVRKGLAPYWTGMGISYKRKISRKGPTAWTDGISRFFNPEFILFVHDKFGIDGVMFLSNHEVMHPALGHCGERGKRLNKKYGRKITNEAMDYVGNLMLQDAGFVVFEGSLIDERFRNMAVEEVCAILYRENNNQPKQEGQGSSKGEGICVGSDANDPEPSEGEGQPNNKPSDEQGKPVDGSADEPTEQEIEAKRQQAIAQAEMYAEAERLKGNEAGDQTFGDLRGKAYIEWTEALEDFVGDAADHQKHSTYTRLTRRPVQGILRAGQVRVGRPHIGAINDTSGSMCRDLPDVMAELEAMSSDGYTITVLNCDTRASKPETFEPDELDSESFEFTGGGGSDLRPGFKAMLQEDDIDALVVTTDGYVDLPYDPPEDIPTLFILVPGSCELPSRWTESPMVTVIKKI